MPFFRKPLTLTDPFFGKLRYADGYFEGKGFFEPTQSEADLLIEADATGPAEQQCQFYQALQEGFDRYGARMKPLIEAEFRNWMGPDFRIADFNFEFKVVCVTIPRPGNTAWDMSLRTIHDRNHEILVGFSGETPVRIMVDG